MGQINIIFVCTNHNKILSENKMLYPYIYWSRKEEKSLHKDNINGKNVGYKWNLFFMGKDWVNDLWGLQQISILPCVMILMDLVHLNEVLFWIIIGDIHLTWANLGIVETKKKKQREDIHGDNWKQNSLGIIAQNNVPTIPLLDFRTSPKINISPSSPQNDCFLFSPTHYKKLKSQLLIYIHI